MNIYYKSTEIKKNQVDTQIFVTCSKCGRPIMNYTSTFFCGYPASDTVKSAVIMKLSDISNEYCPKCGAILNVSDNENGIYKVETIVI